VPTLHTDAHPAAVAATFERLFGLLRRSVPTDELSLTAASTLGRLDRAGAHRLTDLASLEGVTQPAMTQLVTRLVRDDLAVRGTDPVDRRVVLVEITKKGRDVLRRRRAVRAEHLDRLLDSISPADRRAILAALPALDRLADLQPP
jgi:DNA-binding MarR family transcriptional regulator